LIQLHNRVLLVGADDLTDRLGQPRVIKALLSTLVKGWNKGAEFLDSLLQKTL